MENGTVTANNIGTAEITAVHNELSDSLQITVKPIDVKSINIVLPNNMKTNSNDIPKIKKGTKLNLKAEVLPQNATYKNITWSISNKSLATINEDGVLTSTATGYVTVTATAKNGVTEKIKIEIYSSAATALTGFCIVPVCAVGVILYFKKRKKLDIS